MNRQKNISIDEKKLFIILQVIIYIFFLTKYLAFVSEQQIWYDDAHELLLKDIYFSDYKSFLRIADHHIGFSLLIKLLVTIFGVQNIYVTILFFNLSTFFLINYLIAKKIQFNISILISQVFIFLSPVVVDYIYRPKQYFLDFCVSLFLIFYFSQKNKNTKNIFIFLFVSIFFSNILIVYFIVPLFNYFLKHKNRIFILVIFIPLVTNSILKLSNPNFRKYWNSYYESGSESLIKILYNNLLFLRSFNDQGFLFLVCLLTFFATIALFFYERKIFWSCFLPILFLNTLNIFNFYPVGAGRTDLIMFPIFYFGITYLFKGIKIKYFSYTLLITCLILFQNIENKKIRNDFTNEILEIVQTKKFDTIFISYYSIPQTILFNDDYAIAKSNESKCFYQPASEKVKFLRKSFEENCKIETNLNDIIEYSSEGKSVVIIGKDSNTQQIENFINSNVNKFLNLEVLKFGDNDLLIFINMR